MQEFSEHEARRSAWALRFFVALAAIGFAISAVRFGLLQNDDSVLFAQWAETLRGHGFDYARLARDTRFVYSPLVYSGWLTVVAVLQAACGPDWRYALVGLNYACGVATVAGVMLVVRRLTGSAAAVALTGALAVGGVELWLWVPYVLSDSTFALLAFVLYAVGVERLSAPLTPRRALGVLAMAAVVAAYRPGGLPLLVVALTGLALNRTLPEDPVLRARRARRLVAAELLAAAVLVVAHAELMRDPARWPIRPLSPWVRSLSAEAHGGRVMFHRPELNHAPPIATADFVGLTLDKLLHFYGPFAPSLRLERKVLWLTSLPLVYALAAAGAWRMFQARGGLSDRAWWAAWLALQILLTVGLFHGLQVVDRDWRYRLPCLPPLLVLAGIGYAEFQKAARPRPLWWW